MLLQMAIFHSFHGLSDTPLCICIYHIFLSQLYVDGSLGCFHVLAIVNRAAMNPIVNTVHVLYHFKLEFSFFFQIYTPKWNFWIKQ